MTVEVLAACDFAQDAFGKLTMVGAFDAITVREFPAVHPYLCIAMRLRFPVYEMGQRSIRVEIRDAQGDQLAPAMDGSVRIDGIGGDSACANLTLNLFNLRLEREGRWQIVLSVDGQERASVPLFVRKLAPQRQNPLVET